MLSKIIHTSSKVFAFTINTTKSNRIRFKQQSLLSHCYTLSYSYSTTKDTTNDTNDISTTDNSEEIAPRLFYASPTVVTEHENWVESMTPKKIVESLNKYIIGQHKAKRAVAVSLRNRWRRQQLKPELKKEVMPMNILMIGPTGTGKTEIARRLAQMVDAPLQKCEATKYTEVGIVGSSAEESVKDLVDKAVKMEREKRIEKMKDEIDEKVEHQILARLPGSTADIDGFTKRLREGEFDNTKIEVASFRLEQNNGMFPMGGRNKSGMNVINLSNMFSPQPRSNVSDTDRKNDRVPVSDAREIIKQFELSKALDEVDIRRAGTKRAEESGIIFLDEIDKLCSAGYGSGYGGVKGEGVQKELLGLIEGTTVQTDHGVVHTDHMLFIAAGSFHTSNPSDLLPELQGRLPIRVELEALTENDFKKILTETEANLIQQQKALFDAEGVQLEFTDDAINELSRISKNLNESIDNIGARRLRAVISKLVESISYDAPDKRGDTILVDKAFVEKELEPILTKEDLSRYIL